MNDYVTKTLPDVFPRIIIPELTAEPRRCATAKKLVLQGSAFATTWQVVAFIEPGKTRGLVVEVQASLQKRFEDMLARINRQMSPFLADSDLTRFNEAPAGEFVALPSLFLQVMHHALEIAALTDGAFDPGLLPAVDLWGFGPSAVADSLPQAGRVQALARAQGSWRDLIWQGDGMIRPEGVRFDLCAIAKGFAVDALMRILRSEPGASSGLVEIGGELKGWGVNPDGLPFWVDVEPPLENDNIPLVRIALCDWAVATSGDARRSFTHGGQVYSHIMDARTQAPTMSNILSATVFDLNAWRADALATALMVMGDVKAMAFAQRHAIACLLRVRETSGRITERLSPLLEEWI